MKKIKKQRRFYSSETKQKALRYYLIGLSLPEISKLLDGISIRTIEGWQAKEGWTKTTTTFNIKQRVYDLYQTGKTYKEISKILLISNPTIYRYIKEIKNKDV